MKIIIGKVIKKNSDKTITISVRNKCRNKIYKKTLFKYKNYKIHDEYNLAFMDEYIIAGFNNKRFSKTKILFLKKIILK